MRVALGSLVLLAACINVPKSLITLSDAQRQNIEQHNKTVDVLLRKYEADARALVAEHEKQYDALERRAESWQNELNRLIGNLRTLTPIEADDTRHQQHLEAYDIAIVRNVESILNTRIGDFDAFRNRIDVTLAVDLWKADKKEDALALVRRLPENLEDVWSPLVTAIEEGEAVEALANVVQERVDDDAAFARKAYDNAITLLLAKVVEIETFKHETLATSRKEFLENKARPALNAFLESLEQVRSDGRYLAQTQSSVTHSIKALKEVEIPAHAFATGFAGIAGALGETGVIKSEESKAFTELFKGFADAFKPGE